MTIAPLKRIKALESETEIPRVVSKGRESTRLPWIITGVVLVVCCQLWFAWAQSAKRLRDAEQALGQFARHRRYSDAPACSPCIGKIRAFKSPSTIGKLGNAATSSNPEIRLAALKTLQEHAAESRSG